jgi:hypothetical protein
VINGQQFSGHAIDEMQSDGITPSVALDAIAYGQQQVGFSGRVGYYSKWNNVTVVVDGVRVVTVSYGRFKIK